MRRYSRITVQDPKRLPNRRGRRGTTPMKRSGPDVSFGTASKTATKPARQRVRVVRGFKRQRQQQGHADYSIRRASAIIDAIRDPHRKGEHLFCTAAGQDTCRRMAGGRTRLGHYLPDRAAPTSRRFRIDHQTDVRGRHRPWMGNACARRCGREISVRFKRRGADYAGLYPFRRHRPARAVADLGIQAQIA